MILLLSRVYEQFEVLKQTLRSRGVWTDDDERAFSAATHSDDRNLLLCALRARADYLAVARQCGMEVDDSYAPQLPKPKAENP